MSQRASKPRRPIDVKLRIRSRGAEWYVLLISENGVKDVQIKPLSNKLDFLKLGGLVSKWEDLVRFLSPNEGFSLSRDLLVQAGRAISKHLLSAPVLLRGISELEATSIAQDRPLRFFVDVLASPDRPRASDALLACLPLELFCSDGFNFWFRSHDRHIIRYDSELPAQAAVQWSRPAVLIATAARTGDLPGDRANEGNDRLTPEVLAAHTMALDTKLWSKAWPRRILKNTTKASLQEALQTGIDGAHFEIIYIICHGLKDDANAGSLELWDGRLAGTDLGRYFERGRENEAQLDRPRPLVILCCCSSAVPHASPDRRGMAQHLVSSSNVQWALGFRGPVSPVWAMNFCDEVFNHLLAGESVESAVGKARIRQPEHDSQWALPILCGRVEPASPSDGPSASQPPMVSREVLLGAYAELSPAAKDAFRALGALPRVGIPVWLVARVLGDTELNTDRQLRSLVDYNLFSERGDKSQHYSLHPVVWEAARQELKDDSRQWRLFRERATQALAERAQQILKRSPSDERDDPHAARHRLSELYSNLELEDWTNVPKGREQLALAFALLDEVRQHQWSISERLRALSRAAEWSSETKGGLRSRVLRARADLWFFSGSPISAVDAEYQAALALLTPVEDATERATILVRRSRLCQRSSRGDEAMTLCMQALDELPQQGSELERADVLVQLGELSVAAGAYEPAMGFFEEARFKLLNAQDNPRLAALHLARGELHLALAALHLTREEQHLAQAFYKSAQADYIFAIQCSRESKDRRREGWGLLGQGREAYTRQEFELAKRWFDDAYICFSRAEDRPGEAAARMVRGQLHFQFGLGRFISDPQGAYDCFNASAADYEKAQALYDQLKTAGYSVPRLYLPGDPGSGVEAEKATEQLIQELGGLVDSTAHAGALQSARRAGMFAIGLGCNRHPQNRQ